MTSSVDAVVRREERVVPYDVQTHLSLAVFGFPKCGTSQVAEQLSLHLARGAVRERAAEVDLAMVDLLIGCEYLSHEEARLQLEPHLQEPSTSLRVLDVLDSF